MSNSTGLLMEDFGWKVVVVVVADQREEIGSNDRHNTRESLCWAETRKR